MIRVAISPAAYAAIAATLPSSVGVEEKRAPNGDYFIWLDGAVVAGYAPCAAQAGVTGTSFCGWRSSS
jgi:hypothetical protein